MGIRRPSGRNARPFLFSVIEGKASVIEVKASAVNSQSANLQCNVLRCELVDLLFSVGAYPHDTNAGV